MNKNDKIVNDLSEAIVAVLNGHTSTATKLVAQSLRDLTGAAVVTPKVSVAQPIAKPVARNKKKRATDKRGKGPALTGATLTAFTELLSTGMRMSAIAKHFGISEPTAYKYAQIVRSQAAATEPTLVN